MKGNYPPKKGVGHSFFDLNLVFAHKSLLNRIIDGFERIKAWGIDRGICWFNSGVNWVCRMLIHGGFTF